MRTQTRDLVVVGAGPYGLATAAYARHCGMEPVVLGEPMGYWRRHMPKGLLLRSGSEWHLDPLGVHTMDRYLAERGLSAQSVSPLPAELFIEYAEWFQHHKGLSVRPERVSRLDRKDGALAVHLESGEILLSKNVLAAPGFHPFAHIPADLSAKLPPGRYSHTDATACFDGLRGKRCLIIGGRQGALEWAALLSEQAGAAIDVVYRHATPRFTRTDWSWVDPMMAATEQFPGWFRRLPHAEQEAIRQRFWVGGRLQLETWLEPRIKKESIRLWPSSSVATCLLQPSGELIVGLVHGARLRVDHVIFATGYRVELPKVPYLGTGSLLAELQVADGYPVLDDSFQSSVPGLYFAGLVSTRDFGPFFGFVRGCPVAARVIVKGLTQPA